jgi:hypothetical protein
MTVRLSWSGEPMALLAQDAKVPMKTQYFDVDLGPGAAAPANMTAVFFPATFVPTAKPDVLVYLHGHGAPPIDRYLADPRFPLREETNAAGEAQTESLLVVAPTLGPKSEAGDLVDRGLDWFLSEVLDNLAGESANCGKVYVAAHSGGGRAARALAMNGSSVVEYWLFDALYAPGPWGPTDKTDPASVRPLGHPDAVEEEWLHVLRSQSVKLYCYSLTPEPTRRAKNIEAFVKATTAPLAGQATFIHSTSPDHDGVPRTHWRDRVNGRS